MYTFFWNNGFWSRPTSLNFPKTLNFYLQVDCLPIKVWAAPLHSSFTVTQPVPPVNQVVYQASKWMDTEIIVGAKLPFKEAMRSFFSWHERASSIRHPWKVMLIFTWQMFQFLHFSICVKLIPPSTCKWRDTRPDSDLSTDTTANGKDSQKLHHWIPSFKVVDQKMKLQHE